MWKKAGADFISAPSIVYRAKEMAKLDCVGYDVLHGMAYPLISTQAM